MRKLFASLLAACAALALAGCGSPSNTTSSGQSSKSGTNGPYKIAVAQYASFPALDAALKGFKAALKDAGVDVKYDESNAQGDQTNANSIAAKFASKQADYDLVFAIATPMAQSIAQNITDTPVLFTAVTDPVTAELVASNDKPGANVTGTTDMNPVAEQIDLIKKVIPDAKKVGIVYSSGEINSQVQVDIARAEAKKQGLEIVEKTVTNTAEVQQAADALGQVDAIYIPTDNNAVDALDSILQVAESKGILVVPAEGDSVSSGGALTLGWDYETLGRLTGEMALKILQGKAKPETMPVESQKNPQLIVNPEAAKRMGFEIPKDLQSKAAKVITTD